MPQDYAPIALLAGVAGCILAILALLAADLLGLLGWSPGSHDTPPPGPGAQRDPSVTPAPEPRPRPPDHVHHYKLSSTEETGGATVQVWRCPSCGDIERREVIA
jgi:hypothetical protein